ncbi:MAG: trigger factor [Novosphingobium sp.]
MQIVETSNEGLRRGYAVTIPAQEIAARVDAEVRKIAPQVRMPGFRPGKVPANLVRKMHGAALHQDALAAAIREAMDKLVRDEKLRPAMQPDVTVGEDYAEGKDAELTVALEVLPQVALPELDGLKLDKLVVPVTDAEVDEAVARIASGQKAFADAEPGRLAETGDQVVIDFVGKLDGEPFEGGTAEGQPLELGAGRFIPGFEEQLVGVTAGDTRTIAITFPADYAAAQLKGRDATFDITVKAVKVAGETSIDDAFAKSLGLESLEQLRGLLRGQLEQETAGQTRTQMKRALLDQLAAGHDFEVPPTMVEAEFRQIWAQLEQEAANEPDPEAAKTEIESEREEYRAIAVRRVRLGLLLSEIGQANSVQVTPQEMEMLIQQAARQYREEDRERFIQYIRSDALAAAQLRAPLYEDKVVDFLFDKAELTTREVTREELQAAIEADGDAAAGHVHGPDCDHDHAHEHEHEHEHEHGDDQPTKPAKKKAAPKKPKADAPAEAEADAEPGVGPAKSAKKPAARKAAAVADEADEAAAKPAKKAAGKTG